MREQRNIALHLHGQDVSSASCAGAEQIFFYMDSYRYCFGVSPVYFLKTFEK